MGTKKDCRWLYILTFAEFWDRFCYYGIQALLVLYVTKILAFNDAQAYGLYGTFTALTFITPLLGGVIADQLLGLKHSVIVGGVLMVLGNIFLSFPGQQLMYLGLAVLICGIGLFKPNNTAFVGVLYKSSEAEREGAFSIYYMGMNAGALLSPIIYAYIAHRFGWLYGFSFSAVGMLFALIIFMMAKIKLGESEINTGAGRRHIIGLPVNQCVYVLILFSVILCFLLLQHAEVFGKLLVIIGLITLIGLGITAIKSSELDRKRIIGLSSLAFFCIFFFACSLQTATTLTLFLEREINRTVLGLNLPTMVFLSLQPFFIILIAPLTATIWSWLESRRIDPSFSTKIAIGLILAAASFVIFSLADFYNTKHGILPLFFVILGNLFLSIGELCVLPVVLTAISQFAPSQIRSTMMGILFLVLSFSGYLAGVMGKLVSPEGHASFSHLIDFHQAFLRMGLGTFSVAVILFFITPSLKHMLR